MSRKKKGAISKLESIHEKVLTSLYFMSSIDMEPYSRLFHICSCLLYVARLKVGLDKSNSEIEMYWPFGKLCAGYRHAYAHQDSVDTLIDLAYDLVPQLPYNLFANTELGPWIKQAQRDFSLERD